jgi:hypothetical protein
MERSSNMRGKAVRCITIFCHLLIIEMVILTGALVSYGENRILEPEGETGYVAIKNIGQNSLTIDNSRFRVSGETKIYDTEGSDIKFKDIQKPCKVNIQYQSRNGELTALVIFVKFEPKVPE